MEKKDEKLASAKKAAKEKVDFIRHLIVYVAVIVVLIIINNVTYSGYQWWIWPALGWGIGVFFHGMGIFVFSKGSATTEQMVEKEMKKDASKKQ